MTVNMDRSRILAHMDVSKVNTLSLDSTITPTHPITVGHNRRFVNEIIDDIFDERKGACDVSSSQCSSLKLQSSEYSYDKRLKYWKDVLKDREKLSHKIREGTSKRPADILYNRLTTIDERDKQTVKRIMDYADRMNPVNLTLKRKSVLPEKCNEVTCQTLPEIQETLTKAERNKSTIVEICGLPMVTKLEMMGKPKHQGCEKPYNWLKSTVLETRIEEKREDIERVIEFYPDIENLQIVGESLFKKEVFQHNSQIQLLQPPENICEISSESQEGGRLDQVDIPLLLDPEPIEYGLRVNDQVFIIHKKKSSKNIEITTRFTCQPFGRDVKKLMTLQNIGHKVLNFEWCHRSFYDKNSALLKPLDNEFVFDNRPFRLYRGEKTELSVVYQPRRVDIVKSKWVLKVDPACFCRKGDGIVMRLIGICVPPAEYEKKLNDLQSDVIEKSNMKMMRKLTTGLGAITAQLEPIEVTCPYQRTLNDLELFEQLNPGYKCERYHDLEQLKNLHRRVKKPREKPWDFKVDSLKFTLLRVADPESRALFFNELSGILDTMKGKCLELEQRIIENPEKRRARFLYVRGIVGSSIDEWEELTFGLEEAFLKTTLHVVNEEHQSKAGENVEEINTIAMPDDEDAVRSYVKRLKPFRDSLYMQTYTLLCNFTENIVNIIESTEVI